MSGDDDDQEDTGLARSGDCDGRTTSQLEQLRSLSLAKLELMATAVSRTVDLVLAGDGRALLAVAVICVEGVDGVEAVLIRHVRTGRECAVNASA